MPKDVVTTLLINYIQGTEKYQKSYVNTKDPSLTGIDRG